MKKIILLVFLLSPAISFAQVSFGSPSATARGGAVTASAADWEAIGINPSNLGWSENHAFSMSIMNVGLNFQDNALTIKGIKQTGTSFGDSITPAQRQEVYNALTASSGLNISSTITWAALSFSIPKIGGFAVNLTDEFYAHAQLSGSAATIMTDLIGVKDSSSLAAVLHKDSTLLSQPMSQILNGSNIGGYHYRELNIDFGRKLWTIKTHNGVDGGASFENSEYLHPYDSLVNKPKSNPVIIYGGFGFKPIWGLGDFNGMANGGGITEEGTYVYSNPGYFSNITKNIFTANGRGYGVDLGLSASYKKWKFGASAIDLGKINWQNTSITSPTVKIPPTDTLIKQLQNNTDILKYFGTQAPGANYSTQLPSQFRSGVAYILSDAIQFSADYVAPLNNVAGNIINPYLALGTNIRFFNIIGFSVGVATEKGFGYIVPAGVFVNLVGAEIFVATNDVRAFLNNSNSTVLSASFGVRLFGF